MVASPCAADGLTLGNLEALFHAVRCDHGLLRTFADSPTATPLHTVTPMQDSISNRARAALYLLNSPMFCEPGKPRFHVDRMDCHALLKRGTWSSGERLLIEVAGSLAGQWTTSPTGPVPISVDVGRLIEVLDRNNLQRVLSAIEMAS